MIVLFLLFLLLLVQCGALGRCRGLKVLTSCS